MANELGARPESKMDAASLLSRGNLYRPRRRNASVLVPVTRDGGPDQTRPTVYVGEAQITDQHGPAANQLRNRRHHPRAKRFRNTARLPGKASTARCASCRSCGDRRRRRYWCPARHRGWAQGFLRAAASSSFLDCAPPASARVA